MKRCAISRRIFSSPVWSTCQQNTVTLLGTNPNFVESFLVGLNAEMSHELLWRNYPTDQRGTYFRQFWDTSVGNDEPDIEAINKWGDRQLGQNSPNTGGKLVLLIRGELLRRYPNSVIYAVAAVPKDGRLTLSKKPEDERHPLFRGSLKPDVTFLGFDLTEARSQRRATARSQRMVLCDSATTNRALLRNGCGGLR